MFYGVHSKNQDKFLSVLRKSTDIAVIYERILKHMKTFQNYLRKKENIYLFQRLQILGLDKENILHYVAQIIRPQK